MSAGRPAWLAVLLWLAGPLPALTLDLPAGADLVTEEGEPLATHRLATGPWVDGALPLEPQEGAVTREVWQVPDSELSTLGLLAPLREQLMDQGWDIRLDCETEACGGFDFRAAIEVLPPPWMFVDLADFRYLSASRDEEAVSLLVSRSDERGFIQIVRVAPRALEAGQPQVQAASDEPAEAAIPPDDLGTRIEREGRVVLEGLAFAPGSAELAPGGDSILGSLAAYLLANPTRRVALVGHTDAQGALEANIALSRQRAQAVADRLTSAFGVPRTQVEAEGMGWLAPVATNLTPEGRDVNRRVEAVVLP